MGPRTGLNVEVAEAHFMVLPGIELRSSSPWPVDLLNGLGLYEPINNLHETRGLSETWESFNKATNLFACYIITHRFTPQAKDIQSKFVDLRSIRYVIYL
jgi:hypothetical protein